jgi:hypothetical protein
VQFTLGILGETPGFVPSFKESSDFMCFVDDV